MFKKFVATVLTTSGKLWRPVGLWSIVIGIATNCIVIPLWKGTGVDLTNFAALVVAFAPLAAIRTYEKMQDPADPLGSETKPDTDK